MEAIDYIGKAEYCYANSAAMLLAAAKTPVPPETIEVCCGVGLSAFIAEGGQLFFSPFVIAPDAGLNKAFDLLGFQVDHNSFKPDRAIDGLRQQLARGPVLIGPVDMGQLSYNPRRSAGADHFVVVYGQTDDSFLIHDPYGYPNVRLGNDQLLAAWRAEAIDYKQSACQFWQRPRRTQNLSQAEIDGRTWSFFRDVYRRIDQLPANGQTVVGPEAIRQTARELATGKLDRPAIGFLTGFSLPLAAKRAGDYAARLAQTQPEFARLKRQLADQFGSAQSHLTDDQPAAAAEDLELVAGLEAQVADLVKASPTSSP